MITEYISYSNFYSDITITTVTGEIEGIAKGYINGKFDRDYPMLDKSEIEYHKNLRRIGYKAVGQIFTSNCTEIK